MSKIPQKFESGARYEVTRAMQIGGVLLQPGDMIPEGVPVRRVKQLFESRRVRPSAGKAEPQPAKKGKPK